MKNMAIVSIGIILLAVIIVVVSIIRSSDKESSDIKENSDYTKDDRLIIDLICKLDDILDEVE